MKIYFFTIGVCILLLSNVAKAQKNLITNGGFEDDLYGWNNNGAQLTPYDLKSGKNSCAIVAHSTDKWVGIDQVIKVSKKMQVLEFSAWIKTQNVVKGEHDWDGAIFTVVFLDSKDKEIGDGVNIARLTGYQDWTLFNKVIKVPETAYSIKIMVAMGNASGTMLIDDVTAKMVSSS